MAYHLSLHISKLPDKNPVQVIQASCAVLYPALLLMKYSSHKLHSFPKKNSTGIPRRPLTQYHCLHREFLHQANAQCRILFQVALSSLLIPALSLFHLPASVPLASLFVCCDILPACIGGVSQPRQV